MGWVARLIPKLILLISMNSMMLLAEIPGAWATSFVERPFPESVKDAPTIARGRIGAATTDWGREGEGRRIFTYWDFQVLETFKGKVEPTQAGQIRIREMGGEKDGMGMQVAGAASFNTGEDVVVFLSERNSEGSHDVWGMMMGKYDVQKSADGEEVLSGPGISGEGHDHGHGDAGAASKWTLESLRRLIAEQGDAPMPVSPARQEAHDRPVTQPSAVAHPATIASADPSPAATDAAPRLQSSAPEDAGRLPGWIWAVGVAILGVAGFLFARKR